MEFSPSSGDENIDALLRLICSATRDAVAEYNSTGYGVPSPDAVIAHPLDTAVDSLGLKKAIRVLEGACERLCTTLAQPMHTIANRSMPYEFACLQVAIEHKIADVLDRRFEGVHVNEIAKKTKLDKGKLRQILRLLVTRGCFREVSENVFVNNRLSLTLLSSNPVSATANLLTAESMRAMVHLSEALADPVYGHNQDADKSAFAYSVRDEGIQGGLFGWYKAHPEIGRRFDQAMVGWTQITGSISFVKNFPWDQLPFGTTFCDIGSGVGTCTLVLAEAHPHLRITLQDLPEPIEQAKRYWQANYPKAVDAHQVKFVPFDFLNESPVYGKDIYYMKHIMHDWPDQAAITILRNVSKAMLPNSHLFIHDFVLKPVHTEDSDALIGISRAPEPLLPNYGTGNLRLYNQDLNMLAMFNSRERTCDEFVELGAQSGLKLIKVWDFVETFMLEFILNGGT